PEVACTVATGRTLVAGDCDDARADVHPGAPEVCDLRDDDCDGTVDLDAVDAVAFHPDADGDRAGDVTTTVHACWSSAGLVTDAGDCDDTDGGVHPGALELCDGVDEDCDGLVDDDALDRDTWFADIDGDGFGDPAVSGLACAPTPGAPSGTDC